MDLLDLTLWSKTLEKILHQRSVHWHRCNCSSLCFFLSISGKVFSLAIPVVCDILWLAILSVSDRLNKSAACHSADGEWVYTHTN